MAAYSPKTGARCSCRPGVQRDNCPRCEGTGWVIDFKKIHERREREGKENPVAWAHGVMSYRHAPGSVAPMMNPRRKRLTRRKARLILHHGYVTRVRGKRRRRVKLTAKQRRFFGARASGYPRRKPRGYGAEWLPVAYGGRKRRNPYRRNPGGGMGWGMIALLGIGAFFLLPRLTGAGGGLFSSLGIGTAAGVPPGYTPIGNNLYRSPSGTIVARNPQTGQMVAAMPGTVPTSAEDLLTRAGIALIPSVASNLASWVSGLFTTQHTATTPVTESPELPAGGGAIGTSDVTRSLDAMPPLAPLPNIFGAGSDVVSTATGAPDSGIFAPELPTLPPINVSPDGILYDLGADTQLGSIDWSQYELPPLPTEYATVDPSLQVPDVGLTVGGTDVTIYDPSADVWGGFFGLGRRSMPGFRVNEARFLRRPPSYR